MDVYEIVTERIIKELEAGTIPWKKPWCSTTTGAFNRISGHQYSLLNQLLLKHGGEYATYDQWLRIGGHVRKGEKAEIVVFWKKPEDPPQNEQNTEDDGDGREGPKEKKRPTLRYYHVFHISQVDGVEPLEKPKLFDTQPIEAAEKLFRDYVDREGITLETGESDTAYYSPKRDLIHIPDIRHFQNATDYCGVAFHEAVHSTGHFSRLGRKGLQNVAFGTETYAQEELIAEIGSAALLHGLGIETDASVHNTAAYVESWLRELRNDKRYIVSAAGQAQRATNYIIGK